MEPGQVGSRVSMSDPVFDPVLSFNIVRVHRGVVSTGYRGFGFLKRHDVSGVDVI